ncbi:NSA2 [Enterospora canceri]|uniref:NSA2 n=1 Tax=Enterospora canceri TaxID=1081671 RepID=A0A1Y1S7K7_9MICR|nr:NSA2 [Enterospora canceri]
MSQSNFVEQFVKENGRVPNYDVKQAKREARAQKLIQKKATGLIGIKGRLFAKRRKSEKIQLKKAVAEVEKKRAVVAVGDGRALPSFLLDRDIDQKSKAEFSRRIKMQRQNKIEKYAVPVAQVEGIAEKEAFGVVKTGKRQKKQWKRIVNRPCFVGADFTRKAPKHERFIRPTSQRMTVANVVHPELNATYKLPILSVKKNPSGDIMTSLGVLSRGTILEVNVSELGIVDGAGQIVWGKYAQITNHPERDGCVNCILLV